MNPTIADNERLRFKIRQSPATAALIIAFIAVFVATSFDFDHRIFTTFAKVNDRVRAGEVWRLFTASFLHAGIMHIWFNGMALASIGPAIERVYGKPQFLIAFLLGGAAGMVASVVFVPAPSVGASAGVFALLGVLLAYAVRARASLAPRARRFLIVQVLIVVGLNVAIGLLAGFIDNAAHLGGLAGGFVLGILLRPKEPLFAAVPEQGEPPATAPAPPVRKHGRSFLGWAGQRWKMVAFLLGMVPWVVFHFRHGVRVFPGWEFLAFFVGAGIAISAKCPRCKERIFWWCVSKLPMNKGLDTALGSQACPICGYPDEAEKSELPTRVEQ